MYDAATDWMSPSDILGDTYDLYRESATWCGVQAAAETYGDDRPVLVNDREECEAFLGGPAELYNRIRFDFDYDVEEIAAEHGGEFVSRVEEDLLGYFVEGWQEYRFGEAHPCIIDRINGICRRPGTYCDCLIVRQ